MAAGNVAKLLKTPGRFCIDPTDLDLTGTFPFGGTEIGLSRGVMLRPLGTSFSIWAEEYAEPVEVLENANVWVAAAFLRGWDNDAVETVFPSSSDGTYTQHKVVDVPGSVYPGQRASARRVKLVFCPLDTKNAPGFVAYAAIPLLEEQAELNWQRNEELGLPVVFQFIRDSSARILKIGRIEDIPV